MLQELKAKLEKRLSKGTPASIFLNRMRVLDENSRTTAAYSDPRNIPFYYYLGELIQPTKLVEIGFKLGFCSGNFVKSCKSVQKILTFQEKTNQYYSPRFGRANVRDNYKGELLTYVGNILDEEFDTLLNDSWQLAIINEEVGYDTHRAYLDAVWLKLDLNGLIVMDCLKKHKVAGEAFSDFCKTKNREGVMVETRYETGLILR